MTDPRDKPPAKPPALPKRHMSQTERDTTGFAARKERDAVVQPIVFGPEEITGKYTGEELAEKRARRPTDERLSRLETKHDDLAAQVSDVHAEVSHISGQLTVLPELVGIIRGFAESAQGRENVHFAAQVDIGKAQAKDVIDARRVKRRTIAKVVGGVLGGAGLVEILRLLLERF